jgi:ABC-type bacteriocin/lantibiotic exporter with double-glycine peptidase domain
MLKKDHFLFQYLKKEKIIIDQNEFRFQIESHPDGFSLLSISDTFSFFKIPNLVTRIEHEDLIHLPDRFIALLKEGSAPFLAFIERLENNYLYTYQNKPIIISAEKFDAMFQNIVLLAEQEEQKPVVSKNNKLWLALIPLILIYLTSVFIN